MKQLQWETELSSALQTEKILIVQFGAASYAPCHAICQKIDAWTAVHPMVSALYVPAETFGALAAQLSIFTVPAILVYAEGKLTIRAGGYFSLEEIFAQIGRYETLLLYHIMFIV